MLWLATATDTNGYSTFFFSLAELLCGGKNAGANCMPVLPFLVTTYFVLVFSPFQGGTKVPFNSCHASEE